MSIMLASDDNNPAFMNPINPDDLMQVEFFDYAAEDTWKTQEKNDGTIYRKAECPFVRINKPGDVLNIIERPADGRDIKRFPRQWMYYQMQTGQIADGMNVPGFQIESWDELDHATKHKLRFLRFVTVEQLAGATDSQLQAIGMGADGLRIRARKALQARNRVEIDSAVAERDAKIAAQGEQIAELSGKLEQVLTALAAQAEHPGEERQKRPYNRKSQEQPEAQA